MTRVRLEECGKYIIFMPSEARLEIFLKKIKYKGPKIHYFALRFTVGSPNCITGASKSWGQGGPKLKIPLI